MARFLVRLFFVAVVLAGWATSLKASPECPMCDAIDAWWADNGQVCNYHGSRLGYLCEADPECVEWNRTCADKRAELNACIERCMSGDQRQDQAPELDEFDSDMAEMEREGYDAFVAQQSPEWCRSQRDKLAELDSQRYAGGLIGRVLAVSGDVKIALCTSGVVSASQGTPLRLGDCIETGNRGRIRIVLNDANTEYLEGRDIEEGARPPTYVNLGTDSRICANSFLVPEEYQQTGRSLFELLKGSALLIFKGWERSDTSFSVKAGVSICGIRGSEVIVRVEPSDGSVQMGIIEGHGWIGNRQTGEIRYLEANQWAKDTGNGLSAVDFLSRDQWDAVVAQDGLDLKGAGNALTAMDCDAAAGNWRWSKGNVFALTPDGRWTITNGNGAGNWSCARNSHGDVEILITPDTGTWWTRAVIAPDGMSLSGVTEAGDDVDATRVSP